MSYLVLARKHRPQSFDDVVGQEHITEILKKAIETKRIAHAYLFSGPRGIGKTSCARILAKCLNCEKGPTIIPCGQCSSCKEITNGNSFDVLEIDGASNRGIDEIRALRENVKFAPSYGRYKIYIVDEVHMLTMEAFNALLKTLEEPPEHVKFIFATTAANKVLGTIISRCQKFDFKRVPIKTIVEMLGTICKSEGFKVDQEALYAITKAAQGGLRDALSTLDQLSALSERNIKSSDVFSMLGLVETEFLFQLTDSIADKNCATSLEILDSIIDKGKDIKQLTKDLVEHFRNLMIVKVGGKTLGRLVDYPVNIKELLLTQSEKFSLREILHAIEILVGSQETSRVTDSVRMPLEVALARLTFMEGEKPAIRIAPAAKEIPAKTFEKPSASKSAINYTSLNVLKSEKGEVDLSSGKKETAEETPAEQFGHEIEDFKNVVDINIDRIRKSWDVLTHAVSKEKMSVGTYLQEGAPFSMKDKTLTITFTPKYAFQKDSLESPNNKKIVEKILSEKFNTSIIVEYVLVEEHTPPDEEPLIKTALDTFKGKVVNKWNN